MKISVIFLLSLLLLGCSKELDGVNNGNNNVVVGDNMTKIISLNTPGTLCDYILETEMYDVSSLILSGKLNGSDLLLIKKMAGADEYGNSTNGKLKYLNIEAVDIIAGGDAVFIEEGNSFYVTKDKYLPVALFYNCTHLEQVVLPNLCYFSGSHTFFGCKSLKSIVLPNNVSYIPKATFYNCFSLTDINLMSSITNIGDFAFTNCLKLSAFSELIHLESYGTAAFAATSIKKFKFPDNKEDIPAEAFYGCKYLEISELPMCIRTIGDGAFYECKKLTHINFEKYIHLESIGKEAFYGSGLESEVNLPASLNYIGHRAFVDTGVTRLVINSNIKTDVPEDPEYAGDYSAFRACHKLREIIISEGVTHLEIGSAANWSLSKIVMPSSLESIGTRDVTGLFFSSLSSTSETIDLKIPDNVSYIAPWTFGCCTSLNNVELPSKLFALEDHCFSTSFIKNIKLNDGLKIIGNKSLSCNHFRSIKIPESVEVIEAGAFAGCENLEKIEFPDGVKKLGESVCEECTTLQTVVLPSGINKIPDCMFIKCKSLINITLHNNIVSIGNSAFQGCNSLSDLNLPAKLQSIENYALSYCPELKTIEIPISVMKIGEYAFSYTGIESYKVNWTTPVEVPSSVFEGVDLSKSTLFVPANTVDLYKDVTPWNQFGNIQEF